MKLSIDAIPVMKGTVTGALCTIPGAPTSTDAHFVLKSLDKTFSRYSRPESIRKSPKGLITSPKTPKPQRVFTNLFVLKTGSPIDKADWYPPIKGTLQTLSSRFQTKPAMSPLGL